MKKLILVAVFIMLGIAANAQSSHIEIDTTDATIKYLLERIDELEHKVYFESDKNNLDILANEINDFITTNSNGAFGKPKTRKLVESFKERHKVYKELISTHANKYKYTDSELGVLNSTNNRIGLLFDWINQ